MSADTSPDGLRPKPPLGTWAQEQAFKPNIIRLLADPKNLASRGVTGPFSNYMGGFPNAQLAPGEELGELFAKALRENPNSTGYTTTEGTPAFRGALAELLKADGIEATAENIFVGVGSQLLLYGLFGNLIEQGVTTLITSELTYPGAISAALPHNPKEVVGIPSGKNAFDIEALRDRLEVLRKESPDGQVHAVVYVNARYSNPSGQSLNDEEIRGLGDLANEYGFYILNDGAYDKFSYGENPSIIRLQDVAKDKVIETRTFSKEAIVSRLGYVHLPPELVEPMSGFLAATQVCPPEFMLQGYTEWIQSGAYDKHLAEIVPAYGQRVRTARRAVMKTFPKGTVLADGGRTDVYGGIFVFPILPEGYDVSDIVPPIREAGVGYANAADFTQNTALQTRGLRLAVANKTIAQIKDDLARLGAYFTSLQQ